MMAGFIRLLCRGDRVVALVHARADLKKDLHNFAFLGRSARIGTASDWVWYNVPHGPKKQLDSFFAGQRCIRQGKEQARRGMVALLHACMLAAKVSNRPVAGVSCCARAGL